MKGPHTHHCVFTQLCHGPHGALCVGRKGAEHQGVKRQELEKVETQGAALEGSALLTLALRRPLDIRSHQPAGEEPHPRVDKGRLLASSPAQPSPSAPTHTVAAPPEHVAGSRVSPPAVAL